MFREGNISPLIQIIFSSGAEEYVLYHQLPWELRSLVDHSLIRSLDEPVTELDHKIIYMNPHPPKVYNHIRWMSTTNVRHSLKVPKLQLECEIIRNTSPTTHKSNVVEDVLLVRSMSGYTCLLDAVKDIGLGELAKVVRSVHTRLSICSIVDRYERIYHERSKEIC